MTILIDSFSGTSLALGDEIEARTIRQRPLEPKRLRWFISGNDRFTFPEVAGATQGRALKATLDKNNDPNVFRSEIRLLELESEFPFGQMFITRFRILLPTGYETDINGELLMQFHGNRDEHLGEDFRPPPLSLRLENGNWFVDRRWDATAVSATDPFGGSEAFANVASALGDVGNWVTWTFIGKWVFDAPAHIEVWKDSTQVLLNTTDPLGFNDVRPPYFKMGIYKYPWRPGSLNYTPSPTVYREVFYDDLVMLRVDS